MGSEIWISPVNDRHLGRLGLCGARRRRLGPARGEVGRERRRGAQESEGCSEGQGGGGGCGEEEGSAGAGMHLGGWFRLWLGWDLWMVGLGERWSCQLWKC